MPRPGLLTRGRSNRSVKTPGGRLATHRRKHYRSRGTCALSGETMHLSKVTKKPKGSRSSKRPNRPYGGYATAMSVRRGITRNAREQSK
ncbi:MAG: 50S ribosomal protein L34e [Candidatus Thorarchaeota archaeon]|nr:50S ribosomal protein L34e [Candidatus Thorarchaeota archaeon]